MLKNVMVKFETHAHCLCSGCAHLTPEEISKKYKDAGYGGFILTNHCSEIAYNNFWFGDTHKEKIKYFEQVIEQTRFAFSKEKIKFLFSVEVKVCNFDKTYSDYIVYGANAKMLYDNKPLYQLTQEELFRLCEKNNCFMNKVHPFRDGENCGNPQFMHGAESFNGHSHHNNHNDMAKIFCKENHLIEMSGTDTHCFDQPINAGIYVPNSVDNMEQFVYYIFTGKQELICDYDLYHKAYMDYKNKQ